MGCDPLKIFYWKQQNFLINIVFPDFKERHQLPWLGTLALQGAQSVECWSFAHQLIENDSDNRRAVKSQNTRIILSWRRPLELI